MRSDVPPPVGATSTCSRVKFSFCSPPGVETRQMRAMGPAMRMPMERWMAMAMGVAVSTADLVNAFSAPGVSLGGLPSTTAITEETVHVYAANCGADKIAEIGTKLASCCDESSTDSAQSALHVSLSVPVSVSLSVSVSARYICVSRSSQRRRLQRGHPC